MKLNKTPGNDGFTVEFYCTLWAALGDVLVEVLNEIVINLIEKEAKDTLHIQNHVFECKL